MEEDQVTELTNGNCKEVCNGSSNGISKRSVNGISNGSGNANVIFNGSTNGISNGSTKETNGTTNGITNSSVKETNGVTNGTSNGTKIRSSIKENLKKSKKVLGVQFAPIDVPWERRMQTFAALTWITLFFLTGFGGIPILLYIIFYTNFGVLAILYIAWIYYDRNTCHKGGSKHLFIRYWSIWKHYKDYFPIKLVKTVELDPKRNYLFGSHPHGILCSGAFACFGTEALNVKDVFPGMSMHILTLGLGFWLPFYREFLLSEGMCSATKESMNYLLSYPGGGQVAVLVPGGAPESLDSHPGSYIVQLSRRKGFIKVAIRNGSPLVPVISFGETDIYDQPSNPEGSLLRRIQNKMQQTLEFAPVFFIGRGVFQYSFGLLPQRRPITTVVGAPLDVEKNDNPSNAEIDSVHEKYVKAVVDLFHAHKDKYADPNAEIKIV